MPGRSHRIGRRLDGSGSPTDGAGLSQQRSLCHWASARCAVVAVVGLLGLAFGSAAYADTFVVNSDLDLDGTCSVALCTLRQAINSANANPGRDRVEFAIPPAGPHSIKVLSPLPTVTETAVFNAMTQPGYAGLPLIELNGSLAGPGNGFTLDPASTSEGPTDVRGFVINGFGDGAGVFVSPDAAIGSQIADDYIGTDATGTIAVPNRVGIELLGAFNLVGKLNGFVPNDPPLGPNVLSGNTDAGVFIGGVSAHSALNNAISGNLIGTNAAGDSAVGNGTGIDISIATSTFIGGNTGSGGARNVISGNGVGVFIDSLGKSDFGDNSTTFYNNYIGTDITGMHPLGNNGPGIWAIRGSVLDIGFPDDAYTNVISANGGDGVRLDAARRTSFDDNRIGTDRTGTYGLGNGGSGIALLNDTQGTVIGGGNYFAPNVISDNDIGVRVADSSRNVVGASLIGTDATGTQPLGNRQAGIQVSGDRNVIGTFDPFAGVYYASATIAFNGGAGVSIVGGTGNFISENFIFGNAGLGVDLAPAGVNPNDPGDTDVGPNDLQNYPVLLKALSRRGATTVTGVLSSRPNTTYTIAFFDNVACDPSNFGEGQRPLGGTAIQVTTNKNGVALFSTDLLGIGVGDLITSTAADPDESTSEFSNCLLVRGAPG